METIELSGNTREKTGKGVARQLRRDGLTPGTVYGKKEVFSISVNSRELFKLFRKTGTNTMLNLKIKDKKDRMVIIKELQKNAITREIIHIDLLETSMDKKLRIKVPIKETGTAVGIKMGGILTHLIREIEVECLPADIPHDIQIDISGLEVGQTLHVRDINISSNIAILNNPDETICVVNLPEAEKSKEAEEAAAEEEAAEGKAAEGKAAEGKATEGKAAEEAASGSGAKEKSSSDKKGK